MVRNLLLLLIKRGYCINYFAMRNRTIPYQLFWEIDSTVLPYTYLPFPICIVSLLLLASNCILYNGFVYLSYSEGLCWTPFFKEAAATHSSHKIYFALKHTFRPILLYSHTSTLNAMPLMDDPRTPKQTKPLMCNVNNVNIGDYLTRNIYHLSSVEWDSFLYFI